MTVLLYILCNGDLSKGCKGQEVSCSQFRLTLSPMQGGSLFPGPLSCLISSITPPSSSPWIPESCISTQPRLISIPHMHAPFLPVPFRLPLVSPTPPTPHLLPRHLPTVSPNHPPPPPRGLVPLYLHLLGRPPPRQTTTCIRDMAASAAGECPSLAPTV